MKMRFRLREKLMLITIGAIVLSLSITEYLDLRRAIQLHKDSVEKWVFLESSEIKRLIQDAVDSGLSLGELKGLNEECQKIVKSIPYTKYCFVMGNDGKIYYHNLEEKIGFIYTDPVTQSAIEAREKLVQLYSLDSGEKLYDFSLPIMDSSERQLGLIRIGILSAIIDKEVASSITYTLYSGAFFITLACIMVFVLCNISVLKPIRYLITGVSRIGKGDLDNKIELNTKDEFEELANSFNKMAHDLKSTTTSMDNLNREIVVRKKLEHSLAERVKELNCIYGLYKLTEQPGITLEGIFRGMVDLLPLGWQYPDMTCARIAFRRIEYRTNNFHETKWRQSADIVVFDEKAGVIEVFYLEEKAQADEGPFLKEERDLIEAIAEGLSREIERKQAEDKIKHIAEEWETTFNSITDLVSIHSKDYKIVRVNKAYADTFGKKPEELIGKTCYEIVHGKKEPWSICPHRKAMEKKKPITEAFFDPRSNMYLSVTVSPIFDKGRIIGSVHIAKDITGRKKSEEALQKAYTKLKDTQAQLVQAEKMHAIGTLASGFAHEVKNPLAIIIQGVNFLERKIPPEQEELFKILTMIKDSVRRSDGIIRGLVDFSRAADLILKPEDINTILEESINLVSQRLKFMARIDIVKELQSDLPKILADKNRMEQVFINIFLNAIQAMPEGGRITVRSFSIELGELKDGIGRRNKDYFRRGEQAVVVEVQDTGVGISKDSIEKIFDPFFSTKGPRGGAGLGLAVCRNIIDTHSGFINIESQEGKGTKIILTLKTVWG